MPPSWAWASSPHVFGHTDIFHALYYLFMHFWVVLGTSPTVIRIRRRSPRSPPWRWPRTPAGGCPARDGPGCSPA